MCTLFCANRTRDRGCSAHPVFPAPSVFEGKEFLAKLGRNASRDRESAFWMIVSTTNTAVVPGLTSDAQLRIGGPILRGGRCLQMVTNAGDLTDGPRRMGPPMRKCASEVKPGTTAVFVVGTIIQNALSRSRDA